MIIDSLTARLVRTGYCTTEVPCSLLPAPCVSTIFFLHTLLRRTRNDWISLELRVEPHVCGRYTVTGNSCLEHRETWGWLRRHMALALALAAPANPICSLRRHGAGRESTPPHAARSPAKLGFAVLHCNKHYIS